MDRARDILRSGDWLTRERIRLVAIAILFASTAGFLYLVATAHGGVDLQGRPLGTDFSNVYAAGTYVNDGQAAAAFDPPRQFAREQAIFGAGTQFYGWHYPPYFLFVAAPLALMPYGLALALWQAVTLGLYLLAIRAIVTSSFRGPPTGPARSGRPDDKLRGSPESIIPAPEGLAPSGDPLKSGLWIPDSRFAASGMTAWLLLALAFPAVLINVGHGQNGFLTAALLGGALVVLDRRPLLAGMMLGLLVYKPQYGLMIPLVLAASGRWRVFAAAAATVAVLTIATTLTFGVSVWQAFLDSTEFTRTVVLEQGNTGWYKIQSVFAWARMWGAPIPFAYAVQGAAAVAVGAVLAWLWRSAASYSLKAAALCLATILATPYSFDYDMMVLAPAIAFLAADGVARGFGAFEKTALAALWLVPMVARSFAQLSMIPLGVPAMIAVFFLIVRRAAHDVALPAGLSQITMANSPGGNHVATTSPR
jgi:energy-converting hydrogenase Eha subunit C